MPQSKLICPSCSKSMGTYITTVRGAVAETRVSTRKCVKCDGKKPVKSVIVKRTSNEEEDE